MCEQFNTLKWAKKINGHKSSNDFFAYIHLLSKKIDNTTH